MPRLKGLYLLGAAEFNLIYGPEEQADISALIDIYGPPQTAESIQKDPQLLAEAEILMSGWGMCRADEAFLNAAPRLKAIFYGAGSTDGWLTPGVHQRRITVTSALDANSIPVAEYTLATILFSLKHGWRLMNQVREQRAFPPRDGAPGSFQRTVGLLSFGSVGQALCRLLVHHDLDIVVYDPYLTPEQADAWGVRLVSLEALFAESDVVSVHTPVLSSTIGLVTGGLLASMKLGATFINTARGVIVRNDELIEVATNRTDLQFVLDVVETPERRTPEWPEAISPLYTLPNVVLTPHIAGSVGKECRRMGQWMVEELRRYLAGESLRHEVKPRLERWVASHATVINPSRPQNRERISTPA